MVRGLTQSKSTNAPARLRDPSIAKAIERHIQRQTKSHIRMLHVAVVNGRVFLSGQTGSSYYKELALLAALDVIGRRDPELVELNIECNTAAGRANRGRYANFLDSFDAMLS